MGFRWEAQLKGKENQSEKDHKEIFRTCKPYWEIEVSFLDD